MAGNRDEFPHDVIERRPEVMDAIPNYGTEHRRAEAVTLRPEDIQARPTIEFAGDNVWLRVREILQGALDGIQVCIRPRQFRVGPVEFVGDMEAGDGHGNQVCRGHSWGRWSHPAAARRSGRRSRPIPDRVLLRAAKIVRLRRVPWTLSAH